jgi:hypothetical protein
MRSLFCGDGVVQIWIEHRLGEEDSGVFPLVFSPDIL